MKNNNYYAGHEFQWIQQFLNTIPKGRSRSIAFSIAAAIHHQYKYKKSSIFFLPHSLLINFGIQYRILPIYLNFFQKNGLLKFSNCVGCSFKVELILIPEYFNKKTITTNKLNNLEYTGQLAAICEVPSIKLRGNLAVNNEVDLAVVCGAKKGKELTKKGTKKEKNQRRKAETKEGTNEGTKEGTNNGGFFVNEF